jgi:hypothetical protein
MCLWTDFPACAGPLVLQLRFGLNVQLAPDIATFRSAFQYPSESSPNIASSNFAFPLVSSLRLLTYVPALPSNLLPTYIGGSSSSFPFGLTPNFRWAHHPPNLLAADLLVCQEFESSGLPSTNYQLALAINQSAVPVNQLSCLP